MTLDTDKVDDAALALLLLGASGKQAWKAFAFDVLDRLHERGLIERIDRKSPTLTLTDEGLARARQAQAELFADKS